MLASPLRSFPVNKFLVDSNLEADKNNQYFGFPSKDIEEHAQPASPTDGYKFKEDRLGSFHCKGSGYSVWGFKCRV